MNTAHEHSEQQTKQSRWGFRGMTFRDWLQLLIVPLVLVVIGLVFTLLQDARQQDIEDRRAQQAQKIENQRAESERELAERRAQDEALQAYLDQMSQLMLERKLLEAEHGDPVHTLAQARTATVILRLDAEHNESVTRFLINSGLAVRGEASPRLLRGITLSHATLSGAELTNADLGHAELRGAHLSRADLIDADLSRADLGHTDLSRALLIDADLSDAYLGKAYLGRAILHDAYLHDAYLSSADLSNAFLVGSDLSRADLKSANLSEAEGVSNEELEQQAKTLKGATMPNGQKYEDWLKSKDQEENKKSDGSS